MPATIYYDSDADLDARMAIIADLETVEQIDLLPYHRYGVGKYAQLGLAYPLSGLEEYSDAQVETMRARLEKYGLPVKVGG